MTQAFRTLSRPLILTAVMALGLLSAQANATLPAHDSQGQPLPTLAPLMKSVTPAVVNISTFTNRRVSNPLLQDPFFRRFFSLPQQPQQPQRQRRSQSAGSGVIIDAEQGLVVTNHHVIANSDEIHIALTDGRSLQATLIGSDPDADLALLKVEADNLTEVPLANSDALEVGDFVVAIGNPFGLGQTVTTGIVSALGRTGLGIEGYENFIQTDASINPGNSGGALVNLRGELVGINTAIIAPGGGNVGIGFAIPSNMTRAITRQLEANGEVRRGSLGVALQDISPDLAEAFGMGADEKGILISQISPGSAAEKNDLRSGDVILRVNDQPVKNTAELRSKLGVWLIDSEIKLELLRDGKRLDKTVMLDQPSQGSTDGGSYSSNLKGATLAESDQGVVIETIERNSPAAFTGLRSGDIISAVNRRQINNLDEFAKAANSRSRKLLLLINRGGNVLYLALSNR
ncbi:DegQ family serine endoprotease [Motiliproteus coralliicola]|uniref:DegQ family serine endoprotease n=1 Tax=Motiliproteus coralliicola TaxID=2283196 RepID=A0A369WEI6_9GAMM|nr:DegQ family serine endoprotease [Motiliproteus coralliicola]RDE19751.1 DegQ family serine endoprotease [Motiliproteus coralliicola]